MPYRHVVPGSWVRLTFGDRRIEQGDAIAKGRQHETSSHVRWHQNASIHAALVGLLGKPIAEANALCIPTAAYVYPNGADMASRLIRGVARSPLCELGRQSLGVLELTALPSIQAEYWTAAVQKADALLVGGGDPWYPTTGCGSPGWRTSCRRYGPRQSMWE